MSARRHLAFCLVMSWAAALAAQSPLIAFERARAKLQLAKEEARRTADLGRLGLVSDREVSRARAALRLAQLDFDEAVLSLAGARVRAVVADARRVSRRDGLDRIELVLFAPPVQLPETEGLDEILKRLGVSNLHVSLVDHGVIVGYPYTAVVPRLALGARKTVRFRLLRPVERLAVHLEYQGREETVTVVPRSDRRARPLRVVAEQPSLAAPFGKEASFELTVEPLVGDALTVELSTTSLPPACTAQFEDAATGAMLSSLRLAAGSGRRRVRLVVRLPETESERVARDRPIRFEAVFRLLGTAQEVKVPLELTPRGEPRLEFEATSWLVTVRAGGDVAAPLFLANRGTAPAAGVSVRAEAEEGLTVRVDPSRIERLDPGGRRRLELRIRPSRNLAPGEYVVRMRPQAANAPRTDLANETEFRVRVKARPVVGVALLLAVLLLAVAAGGFLLLRRMRVE